MQRLNSLMNKKDSKKNINDSKSNSKVSTLTRLHQQMNARNDNVAGNMFSDKSDEARIRSMRMKKMALSLIPREEFVDSVPLRLQEQYTTLRLTGRSG